MAYMQTLRAVKVVREIKRNLMRVGVMNACRICKIVVAESFLFN